MYLVRFERTEEVADAYRDSAVTDPHDGGCARAAAVTIGGWVRPGARRLTGVEVIADGARLARALLWIDRRPADKSGRHAAPTVAFRASVDFRAVRAQQVALHAVMQDGESLPLARYRVRRFWRRPGCAADRDVVSIVIPCFNQSEFLGDAIESALAQRERNLQVTVVDDGSTDDTARVARQYPVTYVAQPHRGLAAARNLGIRATAGEFVVFLDADDRLVRGAVDRSHATLAAHADWAFVSGEHRYIDQNGDVSAQWSGARDAGDAYLALLRRNYIGCPAAAMFRRAALREAGGFDETLKACEDYDLFLRIARHFPAGAIDDLTAEYRRHPSSMSTDPALMLRAAVSVLRRQWPLVYGDPARTAAFREGLAFWREYYGAPLAIKTRADFATAGSRRRALRNTCTLVGLAPAVLFRRSR